ncbi:exonuclease domain-containing protein [Halobacillus sp. ACCC02827]|uniref:exonuclease domain-containing protein n=1 Tax=Halobacillus sp. ACCC02827 TaxID=3052090 RepID=UPI002570BFB5|nr:exonuclease domain-containing protein [Halobacillus sp. ACCC02827]WJE17596.1 exonuclease domain-containing protein [Halobacillus sp. ACCC02827]
MNFIALDFETANRERSSVCSIGIVEYDNEEIVQEYYRLVQPKNNYFAPINIQVHGITPEDVADAETFDILWEREIKQMVEGKLVVAHNAPFDIGVLRAVLDAYQLPYPMLAYNCTVNIAKKTWDLPKYKLNVVADHLGFAFHHHHALEDAKASAFILLEAKKELGAVNLKDLIEKTGTTNGMIFDGGYEPARINKRKKARKSTGHTFAAATKEINHNHPYAGCTIAFTGRLNGLKRQDAVEQIKRAGAVWHPQIESTTNYVVVGSKTYDNYLNGEKTTKLERAEQLLRQGASIEILPETVFMNELNKNATV